MTLFCCWSKLLQIQVERLMTSVIALIGLRCEANCRDRGMIAFCWRKGMLKNVNMLTVSKSGRSYIPGKPLSSDLRHIIIDKIIDGGGNPLTMIFPGRFVNLVSTEHASVLAREPLLPPQPVFYSVNTSIYGWRSEFKDSYSDALSSFV